MNTLNFANITSGSEVKLVKHTKIKVKSYSIKLKCSDLWRI